MHCHGFFNPGGESRWGVLAHFRKIAMNGLNAYEVVKLGCTRGRPRLWIEGMKARRAGFAPGQRFNVTKEQSRSMLIIELTESGDRVVSRKVHGDKISPVIDINSLEVLSVFEGYESLRIIACGKRIYILPCAVEIAKKERVDRLRQKLEAGQPLSVGSFAHGGGILTHALHKGMKLGGVETELAFANEIRPELLEHASECNDAWSAKTIPLAAPIQQLAFDDWTVSRLPRVDVVEAGLPCSGASVSGRARLGTAKAEDHPEVGHLVASFLALMAKVNPAVIVFENVKSYFSSASMSIMRGQLKDFGYDVHEAVLQAGDWNELEHRERGVMVAVTAGMEFDFLKLAKPEKEDRKIAEILDVVPLDDKSWSAMQGLKDKQERDKAAGKGFAMQVVTAFDVKCPTITKGYMKRRSTDPKLQHPEDPTLLRQFNSVEHARIKGIPASLVGGLSETVAHEVLGQSVCYAPFVAVGELVAQTVKRIAQRQEIAFTGDLLACA